MVPASKGSAVVTLPTDTQILITREFNAPAPLVFRVFTEPELIQRWWAGRHGTVTSVEVDLRVGGSWRYVMEANGGFEVAFHGEYHEVVPDQRLVNTEIFEGVPETDAPPALCTYTFTEHDDTTTLTMLTEVPDKATRDAIIDSGMESGMQDGYDIAEEIAVELAG
ncbi:ATPase [Nocardioides gansuensis]|uniref:ATPase n=1 Tax=Nocardioides gansuensis TaxID=2138300 RepID=A0A2T8F606_9ACTN|nr:SRPBCC family protein [Nocardioides gansuensis]PVG81138.1 ATPase [Nocardioides gansuensis]